MRPDHLDKQPFYVIVPIKMAIAGSSNSSWRPLLRGKKRKNLKQENIFLCEKFTFGDLKSILSVFFFLKSGGSLYHVIIAERMKDGKSQASWNNCENELMSMSRGRDKEKIWVPDRIWTYGLPNTGWPLYPLVLRRTHEERGHILRSYLIHVLQTARISNVDVVLCGESMKDGNFEGWWNRCENQLISMSRAWDEKNFESPTGFKPMTSQAPSGRCIHLSYRELTESEFIFDMHPAYCKDQQSWFCTV